MEKVRVDSSIIGAMAKVTAWLPAVLWASLIFFLSSLQRVSTGQPFWTDFAIKKTLHILIYFILFLTVLRGINFSFRGKRRQRLLLAAAIALFYAATDELHQTLVPTREGRPRDVFFDAVGISFGLWLVKDYQVLAPPRLAKLAKEWLAL